MILKVNDSLQESQCKGNFNFYYYFYQSKKKIVNAELFRDWLKYVD